MDIAGNNADFPPGMEPVTVIESFDAALNARDVERVLKFFADDATVRFMYPAPFQEPDTYNGKDEIRAMLRGYLAGNFRVQSYDHRISLNEVTWRYRSSSQRFTELGVEEVGGAAGAAFEDGKIKRLTMSFDPDSTAAVDAALSQAGIGGPISEGLAGLSDTPAPGTAAPGDELAGERPNRGPTWDPVGSEDHQPPPTEP